MRSQLIFDVGALITARSPMSSTDETVLQFSIALFTSSVMEAGSADDSVPCGDTIFGYEILLSITVSLHS